MLEEKLGITLGADNLFDQYPDRLPVDRTCRLRPAERVNLNGTNALAFSRYSPYGFNGRFLLRPHVVQLVARADLTGII